MATNLVDDIKNRLTVEDVVGSYVNLRKSGSYFKALSPFQVEKTPSLIVTPAKQIWKDFSSGRGGDIFSFVQAVEGVDFPEALELLAAKAGLDPADYHRRSADPALAAKRRALYQVLDLAVDFYQQNLLKAILDDGPAAKYYKARRGLNRETCINFRIGYALPTWQSLVDHLKRHRVDETVAVEAGLIKQTASGRWRDQFVDRLIVPLLDTQGRVIGFTGRLIDDSRRGPKYINSPQTLLYNKSQHIFGYSQAKAKIGRAGYTVVVEGNLDVLTAHQAGYQAVVATGGTALTSNHFRVLSRLASEIRLAFDGDRAGVKATERAIALAAETSASLMVIPLPSGQDPDDLIRQSPDRWQQLHDSPQPALDWLYGQYCNQFDLKTAIGKRRLTDAMLAIVGQLNDSVEIDHYLDQLTQIGAGRPAIDRKYAEIRQAILADRERERSARRLVGSTRPEAKAPQPVAMASSPPVDPRQINIRRNQSDARQLLRLILANPSLVVRLDRDQSDLLKKTLAPDLLPGQKLLSDYRQYLDGPGVKAGPDQGKLARIRKFHQKAFDGQPTEATVADLDLRTRVWVNLSKRLAAIELVDRDRVQDSQSR